MSKALKIIDLNLFSGSTEVFRTAVGGYWEIVSSSEGSQVQSVEYNEDEIVSQYISKIEVNTDLKEEIDSEVVIPNKRFPVRLYGNADYVKDDNYWRTVLLGGTFAAETFDAIFTNDVYDNYSFDYIAPYSQQEANYIPTNELEDVAQISYDYNLYIEEYQTYIKTLESERVIPNMYLLNMFKIQEDTEGYQIDSDITDFVTLDGYVIIPEGILMLEPTAIDNANSSTLRYFSSSVPTNPLSASIISKIDNKLENIFIDYDENTLSDSVINLIEDSKDKIPYYVKFNFNMENPNYFAESLARWKYSQKFLKTLKEAFNGDVNSLASQEIEHAVETKFLSGTLDFTTYSEVITTDNKTLRCVDFMDLITYSHNNFLSTTDNCYYLGREKPERSAAMDVTGSYRYFNTISSLGVLNDAIDFVGPDNFDVNSIDDLYNLDPKYHETLAYRIEKIGGSPTGDSLTQNVLQNFWIFNPLDETMKIHSLKEYKFYDSQIEYDSDYTYNIYAYVLVMGMKYNFSDLRLTRQIGTTDLPITPTSAAATFSPITEEYKCLEFYDPLTNETIEQIFSTDSDLMDINQAATNAQLVTKDKYLADFYINYEPTLMIKEVPIMSKTLKCLDNPTNILTIHPYQYLDRSQRIGFFLDYGVFYDEAAYPSTISNDDEEVKMSYLNANDLLESQALPNESVSNQRFIEIYRLNEKPSAISDFTNSQIGTIDLKIPELKNSYSNDHFTDTIRSNHKYYYLFRVLNEQRIQSHLSEIYEAQLINDGGYLYSIFNVIHKDELEEKVFDNPSIPFKKLLQLQPNISHLTLNIDDVDFEDEANNQLSNIVVGNAEDLIWNKTFKIRATSKKTGKKIDFNITYKLESE